MHSNEPVAKKAAAHGESTEALHREKLTALGTLTAGLMHELHNPGLAAARASTQLRGNLMRLQQMSLRFSQQPHDPAQMDCMRRLLEAALERGPAPVLSSIAEADAAESLATWLAAAGVENAFIIAPALVAIGFRREGLECARRSFQATGFSDTLNWLEALVSSATLVTTIEESIARIAALARSVKDFAHDDRCSAQAVDLHTSLQSSLTLLGHKMQQRQVTVIKSFSAAPASLRTQSSALSQVWTNLLDNAIDASPPGAEIEIATWNIAGVEKLTGSETESAGEAGGGWLAVSIVDRGAGIAATALPHIFDAFYTTKPQGQGTGLGLEIVHRIVTQTLGGSIEVESQPGRTRFLVRLPLASPAAAERSDLIG
jgi:signal transduction histidine kinase